MTNRFHSKWHRGNHHSYNTPGSPDTSHDPIASPAAPYRGDMVVKGAISAMAPLSSYAAYYYSNGDNGTTLILKNEGADVDGISIDATGIGMLVHTLSSDTGDIGTGEYGNNDVVYPTFTSGYLALSTNGSAVVKGALSATSIWATAIYAASSVVMVTDMQVSELSGFTVIGSDYNKSVPATIDPDVQQVVHMQGIGVSGTSWASFAGDIKSGRDIYANNDINAGNDITVGGDLVVYGTTSISSLNITNDLTVEGNTNISGSLSVGQNVYGGQDIIVTGNSFVSGSLSVDGDVQLNQDLTLEGNGYLSGDVGIASNLTVEGNTSISGDLYVDNNISFGGEISGTPSFLDGITVIGPSFLSGDTVLGGAVGTRANGKISGSAVTIGQILATEMGGITATPLTINASLTANAPAYFNTTTTFASAINIGGNVVDGEDQFTPITNSPQNNYVLKSNGVGASYTWAALGSASPSVGYGFSGGARGGCTSISAINLVSGVSIPTVSSIDSFSNINSDGAYWELVVHSTDGDKRTSRIDSVWDGTTYKFTETSTESIGLVTGLELGVGHDGSTNIELSASISDNKIWAVEGLRCIYNDGGAIVNVPSVVDVRGFKAFCSSSYTIIRNTWTVVGFNDTTWNPASAYDTSTYRYTPGVLGTYHLTARVLLNKNFAGFDRGSMIAICKNDDSNDGTPDIYSSPTGAVALGDLCTWGYIHVTPGSDPARWVATISTDVEVTDPADYFVVKFIFGEYINNSSTKTGETETYFTGRLVATT